MHICNFQAGQDVTRKTKYEDLKAEILRVGRFSCFEATANQWAAGLFTHLCRDPEIETDHEQFGFPWTGVKLTSKAEANKEQDG